MYPIPFALSIVLTLFQSGRAAEFALNDTQKKTAFFSIIRGTQSRGLPDDVLQYFRSFIPIDDWSRLELVFDKTSPRTQGIMDLVKRNRNKKIGGYAHNDSGQGQVTIKLNTNHDGNMESFYARRIELTNGDIMDLSKLPSTLQLLDITQNRRLTEVNLRNLPRNIVELNLSNNQLTKLDLGSLPPSLRCLSLHHNNLTEVHFKNAPKALGFVGLHNNPLHHIDISSLIGLAAPHELDVCLNGNRDDFEVISDPPIDPDQWKNNQWHQWLEIEKENEGGDSPLRIKIETNL